MATLSEIIAKRQAMWPNATNVEARQALMWAPTVAPVAPTPAPITSQEVQQGVNAVWGTADQRRETRSGIVAGQQIAPAPTPAPVAPIAPTQPLTPTADPVQPKVDATPWITQDSFNQAKAESEKIKAQNEADLSLNKQKSDIAREDQKLVADNANNQLANNEGAILNTLKVGGMIPEVVKSSPYYKSAQQTYNKLQQYSTYSTNELVTAMNQGSIVPWTNVYNEMMKDPAMKQKLTDAQVYRVWNPVNSTQIYENASSEIMSNNPTTANYLADGVITQDEYDQATNNTEVVAKAKEVEEKANKYNTLKAEYDSIEDEVKAQFPWSPFSDSIIADRQKAKYKNLVLAKWEWETSTGTLTELKSQASTLFETNLKLSETRRAEQNQIAAEQRKVQAEKDMLQYKTDFEKKQAEAALNDPATQIWQTMQEFEKMWITSQGSLASKISEFKQSGLSLPEYVNNLRKLYMEKPEYQKIQELESGKLSDAQKFQMQNAVEDRRDLRNFAQQKELARLNKDLTREQFLFELENDPEKKAKVLEYEQKIKAGKSLFDILGKNVGTYEGNRGYDLAGAIGDPLPSGGNWKVLRTWTADQVGSIFIGGKWTNPYGNTVVMQDENGNEIRYSHLQNIGVKPGDILGFGDIVGTRGNTGNVRGANGEVLTAEQLKAGRGAHLDVEIKSNGKLLSNADQVNFLKGLKAGWDTELTDKKFTQYNQTKTGFKSEPIVKSFEEALIAGGDIIQSLWSENWPWDVGAVFNFMKSLDPTSTVREWEFALAAKSAGVWEQFKNIPANKLEGTILTDEQRKAFGKLAMKYIESKWKLYDTKYNDMVKVLENQWIPKSYYPTRMTDYVKQYKSAQETNQNTTQTTVWWELQASNWKTYSF